ncbi:hypothetical protein E2C01_018492 [Portunus trituberculatus]|uniref:Uncharacterized protein n=1 Tax=Portunus trituberculatus TaxID=210409 RepID=A0A5B7DWJ7_PORTR|nr:hypothetical protein [Portunus trituberculatus]
MPWLTPCRSPQGQVPDPRQEVWRVPESAQDLEGIAHKAYTGANLDLMKKTLTSAIEFKSLVKSCSSGYKDDSSSGFKTRKGGSQRGRRIPRNMLVLREAAQSPGPRPRPVCLAECY